MGSNYTSTPLQSGYQSTEALNNEFQKIEDAIDRLLSRKGDSPNQLDVPIDMNSFRIINLGAPVNNTDAVRFIDHIQFQAEIENLRDEAASSANDASSSASAAASSASSASSSANAAASSESAADISAEQAAASQTSAETAEAQAKDIIQQFESGYTGFDEATGYDFGFITNVTTYFDRDFGSIV